MLYCKVNNEVYFTAKFISKVLLSLIKLQKIRSSMLLIHLAILTGYWEATGRLLISYCRHQLCGFGSGRNVAIIWKPALKWACLQGSYFWDNQIFVSLFTIIDLLQSISSQKRWISLILELIVMLSSPLDCYRYWPRHPRMIGNHFSEMWCDFVKFKETRQGYNCSVRKQFKTAFVDWYTHL